MNSDFSKLEKSVEECINYNFGNNLNVDGKSKSSSKSKGKITKLNGQVIILHTNWSKYTDIYPWLYVENNNPNCKFCEQAIKENDDMIETPWTKVGDSLTIKDSLLDEGKILKTHAKSENHEIAYQFMIDSGIIERKDNLEKENKTTKAISDLPSFIPITEWEELIKNFPWLYFKRNSFRCSICEEGFEKQRKAMFPTQWTCPDRMNQLGNPAQKSLRSFSRFEKHQLTINHIKAIEIIKDNSDHSITTEVEQKPVEVIPMKQKDHPKPNTTTRKPIIFSAPNVTTRTAVRKSLCDRNAVPDFLDEKTWLAYKQEFLWIYCSKNLFRCSYCEDAYKAHSTELVPTSWTCPDDSENRNVIGFRRIQSKVRLTQHEQSKNHELAAQLLMIPVKLNPGKRTKTRKSEPLKPKVQTVTVETPVEQKPPPPAVIIEPSPVNDITPKPALPVVPRQSRKSAPMKLVSMSYDEKPEVSSDSGEPRKSIVNTKKVATSVNNTPTGTAAVAPPPTPELSTEEIASIPEFLTHNQYRALKTRYSWFFFRAGSPEYACQTCESATKLQPDLMSNPLLVPNGGKETADQVISYVKFRQRLYRHAESCNHRNALEIVSNEFRKPSEVAPDSRFTRLKTGSKSKIDYKRMSEGLLPCVDDSDIPHEVTTTAVPVLKAPVVSTVVPVGSPPKRRRQSSCPETSSWLCPQCRSLFSDIDDLIRHIALCDYQPPCESSRALACPCNPVAFHFNTITKLDLHAAQEHDNLSLFHCYICSDRFKRISPLYHHMLCQHLINWDPFEAYFPVEPATPVLCPLCSTQFPIESELTQHYMQPGPCYDRLQSVRVVLEDILVTPGPTDMCMPVDVLSLLTTTVPPTVVEEVTILDVEELSEEKEAVIYSPIKKNRNQHNRISRNHPLRRFGPPSSMKPAIDRIQQSKEFAKPVPETSIIDSSRSIEHKTEDLQMVTKDSVVAVDSITKPADDSITDTSISVNQSDLGLDGVTHKTGEPENNQDWSENNKTDTLITKCSEPNNITKVVDIDQSMELTTEKNDKLTTEEIDNSIKDITEECGKLIIDQINQSVDSITEKNNLSISDEIDQSIKPMVTQIDQSVKPDNNNQIDNETMDIDHPIKPNENKIDSESIINPKSSDQPNDTLDQSNLSIIEPITEIDSMKSIGEPLKSVDESINSVVESMKSTKATTGSRKSAKAPGTFGSRRSAYRSRKSVDGSARKSIDNKEFKKSKVHESKTVTNESFVEPTAVSKSYINKQLQIDEPVVKKRRHRRTKKMMQMDEERRLAELLLNPTSPHLPIRHKSGSRAKRVKLDKSAKPEVIDILTQVVDLNEIMRETEVRKKQPVQITTGDNAQSTTRHLKKQPVTIQSQLSPCKKLKSVPIPVLLDEDIPVGLSFMERMKKIRQLKKNRTEQQREQMMAVDRKIAEINDRSRGVGDQSAVFFAKSDRIRKLLSSEQYSMDDLKSIIALESPARKESKRRAAPITTSESPSKQPKHESQQHQQSVPVTIPVSSTTPLPQQHLSPREVSSAPPTPTTATSLLGGSTPKPNSTTSLPTTTSSTTVSDFFSCDVCQIGFKSLRARDNHATTEHKGLRLFCCHVCELSFTTHILLRKHAQKYHIDNVSLAVFGKDRCTNDANFSFQCSFCHLQFTSRSGLNHHVTSSHRPDGDPIGTIDKFINKLIQADSSSSPQSCCICQEVMENQFELEIHIIEHQKESHAIENEPTQFACPKCCRLFFGRDGKSYLKDHYNIVHLEKQPPSCEECDSKFSSTISYLLHQKMVKNCSKKTAEQLKIEDPYEKLNDPSKLAFVCSRCQTLVAGNSAEERFARHQLDCNDESYANDCATSPGTVAAATTSGLINSSISDDLLVTTNTSS